MISRSYTNKYVYQYTCMVHFCSENFFAQVCHLTINYTVSPPKHSNFNIGVFNLWWSYGNTCSAMEHNTSFPADFYPVTNNQVLICTYVSHSCNVYKISQEDCELHSLCRSYVIFIQVGNTVKKLE